MYALFEGACTLLCEEKHARVQIIQVKVLLNAKLREIFWKDFIARTGGTIQNLSNTRLKDL